MVFAADRWRAFWRESPLRTALGKRILVSLLLLSLVPLVLSNSLGYLASDRIIRRLVERDLAALAVLQAGHVRDEIERLQLSLATAVHNDRLLVASAAALSDPTASPLALSGASALATEELAQLRRQLRVFSTLELLRPEGVVVASSPPYTSGVRRPDAGVLRRAAASGRAFAVERTGSRREPRLVIAVNAAESDVGPAIVFGAIRAADVVTALRMPVPVGGVEAFVVDDEGLPVLISRAAGGAEVALPVPVLRPRAAGDADAVLAERLDVIASVQPVPGLPLRFVSQVPAREAFRELRGLRRLSVVLAAAFVLVVLAVASLVSRGIVRPVDDLVVATERIAKGDLHVSVAAGQRDELGLLGQRFNTMAAQLRESTARIAALHQEELRRAEQLATVGELAAGVAHELKTPLLGISGGLQLLGRRLDAGDLEGRRLVEETLARVGRMEDAVQRLLAYARPTPARISRLGLNAVVERALQLLDPRARSSGVEIRRALAADLPPVPVDPEQIGQVVVNLALNGIEAMDGAGRLEVATRRADGSVELSVADSGPGVAAEERERVFRPFYTTKHAGTGLGLAIVRQVVERHGGTVSLTAAPSGGAQFVITLPLEPAEQIQGDAP